MARWLYLGVLGMTVMGLPASAYVLTLTPSSGTVTGLPGSTAGWGYSITNSSSQYMVIVNSYFCESGQDPLFTTCTQSLGIYNDFIATNETVVAPLGTANRTFSSQNSQGAGGYTISSGAAAGKTDSGAIVVIYDLYTANPFTDPTAQQIGGDAELTVPAAVQVPDSTTHSVPALSDWALLALALLLIACATRQLGRSDERGRQDGARGAADCPRG